MTTESVEQRLQKLEEENKKFKLEIERAQAYGEILNILGTLQALHTVCMDDQIGTLFANRPDSKVYFGDLGSYEGADCCDRAGASLSAMPKVGNMPVHLMANPVVEIAADGQTAQGIFMAAGIVAMKDPKTGQPTCMWEWNRYGDDFIKEDGKWKISKLHFFLNFRTPYEEGWLKTPVIGQNGPDQQIPPDGPPTTWHPYPSPFRFMPHFNHPVTGE